MVRSARGPPGGSHGVRHRRRRRHPLRPSAHDRPGSPAALLAHAVPVGEFPRPHVQRLVAHLVRRMGDPPVRTVVRALGPRGAGRSGAAPDAGAPRRRRRGEGWSRQARRGRRRPARALHRRLHRDPFVATNNAPSHGLSAQMGRFVASGVSTGAASLILLSPGRGATERSLGWLSSFDTKALVVELLVLAAFIWSLGPINRVWVSFWGLLLLVGVVGFGILAPLRMHAKPAQAAKLVLLGGFLLRLATMLASEGIDRYRVAAGL